MKKRRTTVLSIAAVMTLAVAGFAAAQGRPPGEHGKPSVTPPPWGQDWHSTGYDQSHQGQNRGHGG